MLYQLQVLSDQLTTTNKKRNELQELRDQNAQDYETLLSLLNKQNESLREAAELKEGVYNDMYRVARLISEIKTRQTRVQSRSDFRMEVQLDRQLTNYQNSLQTKFRELNQLLWRIGEPLRHPIYLKAALDGAEDIMHLLDAERELQLSFAGYEVSSKSKLNDMSAHEWLSAQCLEAADLLKKIGGTVRYNQVLRLSDASCKELTAGSFDDLVEDELKILDSRSAEADEKRNASERVRHVQSYFTASFRSFSKLGDDPRPKTYEDQLRAAAEMSSEELRASLESLLPLCVDGTPSDPLPPLSDQFKSDYTINPRGFLQVAQEKFDRLLGLRLKMDKVEELQERELCADEGKMSEKLALQENLREQLDPRYLGRFTRLVEARDYKAVAHIHRISERESSCSACLVTIPQGLRQRVRRRDELCSCPSCQRILVPFAHIASIKEEVDPLLVSEEERIAMEERGELGTIPACSNCGSELYADKEEKVELAPANDLSTFCPNCFSFIVPLQFRTHADSAEG
jgi:predicted  nucleic acid-binding Zn-ribbon protein